MFFDVVTTYLLTYVSTVLRTKIRNPTIQLYLFVNLKVGFLLVTIENRLYFCNEVSETGIEDLCIGSKDPCGSKIDHDHGDGISTL